MIDYMKNTFKDVVKLVLANLGIQIIWQVLYFGLYTIDSDNGLLVLLEIYGILFVAAGIWMSMVWFGLSIIPGLIGYLVCGKNVTKVKVFIGFVTGTFVILGIYVVFWSYFFITLLVDGLNVWTYFIPVVASAVILVQTMIKVYSGYKNLTTTAYVAPNAYPVNSYPGNNYQVNQNNYGYSNMNYNQAYTPNTNVGEYQAGQQYINPNNNYYG